jgi:hypothetical protein
VVAAGEAQAMETARASLAYALSNFACAPLDDGQVISSIVDDRILAFYRAVD